MVTQVTEDIQLKDNPLTSANPNPINRSIDKSLRKRSTSDGLRKDQHLQKTSSEFKYHGIYYMGKLELSIKQAKGISDDFANLFRHHFKQCTQSLGLLRKVAKEKKPIPQSHLVYLP